MTTVDGKIGYYLESAGADSAVPFPSGVTDYEVHATYQHASGSTGASHEFTLQSDRQFLTTTLGTYHVGTASFNPTFTVTINGVEVDITINNDYATLSGYAYGVGSAFINASAGDVITVTIKETSANYVYLYPIVCI